ncbi:MAG TPA: hypothetical protein VK883_02595 [Arthrobacter sp.]|nr:hypothetical protein [Arthrobacter sp.]
MAGIALMIFAKGGWFTAGMFMVLVGVLIGAWAMFAARRVRAPWNRGDAGPEKDSES